MKAMIEDKMSKEGGMFLFRKRFSPLTGKRIICVFERKGEVIVPLGVYSSYKEAVKQLKAIGISIISRPDKVDTIKELKRDPKTGRLLPKEKKDE